MTADIKNDRNFRVYYYTQEKLLISYLLYENVNKGL